MTPERATPPADYEVTTTPSGLATLQFADGLFPAGGFAHSFGLETYAQDGRVTDRDDLMAFVAAHLEGSAGPADAVAVALAVRQAGQGDVAGWIALDARVDALKPVPEFRAASRQMGRQTLRVAAALEAERPDAADGGALLTTLSRTVDAGLAAGHHAPVFGAALGRAGVEPESAAAAYLYSTAALLVGAGLRLLALGQLDGQRALAAARPIFTRLAAAAASAEIDDLGSFTPGLELAGLRHATLDGRLFRS
jgi:urease accessory protein